MEEIEHLNQKIKDLTSLIDVTSIITSTLDLEELMNLVMEKAQEVMHAEASSIMLVNEESGMLECQIALGSVQEKIKDKIQLKMGQGIAGWVAESGEEIIVPDVKKDNRFFSEIDHSTGFETRSILAAPLKVKDKVIGVAEVINRLDGKPFTQENLELFSTFCRQVALAIENAQMHRFMLEQQALKQQLEAAHRIQQSFMPQSFPHSENDHYFIYARNIPATSVGGDLFDFIQINERDLGIVIGDVSGKGVPAALYMARLISDLRYYSHLTEKPSDLLKQVNQILMKRSQRGMFVSLIYMVLNRENGELLISNAGHIPPLWYQICCGECKQVHSQQGIPLGILPEAEFDEVRIQLGSGDTVLLTTDGLIEAKNQAGQMFSLERLEQTYCECTNSDHPQEIIGSIINKVKVFSGSRSQHDDITLLAVRWQ